MHLTNSLVIFSDKVHDAFTWSLDIFRAIDVILIYFIDWQIAWL